MNISDDGQELSMDASVGDKELLTDFFMLTAAIKSGADASIKNHGSHMSNWCDVCRKSIRDLSRMQGDVATEIERRGLAQTTWREDQPESLH